MYDSQLDLGQADPAITLRVYAHVIRSAEAAAADIFAEAVNAAQSAPAAHPVKFRYLGDRGVPVARRRCR